MAATKKNMAIRAEKRAAHQQIAELNDALRASCNRVPETVRSGSHQAAVAWKTEAERIHFGVLKAGGTSATLNQLHHLVEVKRGQLARMQGAA